MTDAYSCATLTEFTGHEFTSAAPIRVDQTRVDQFAEATGDHQWIHTDVERAKAESPFGGPVAHGFLTLSLLASDVMTAGVIPADATAALNYGLGKVRFLAPVPCGAEVQATYKLADVQDKGRGRKLITIECTLGVVGSDKPAVIAELMAMVVGQEMAA